MQKYFKVSMAAALLACGIVSPAAADGVYKMYNSDGTYIDEIEIIEDVTSASGEEFAVFEMADMHMRFYIDPDAAYVTMVEDNPVFTEQRPFYGYWVSTASPDVGEWPICGGARNIETGEQFRVFGELVWRNYGIAPNGYGIAFSVDLGTCNDAPGPWAYSATALDFLGLGGNGGERQSVQALTEICGNENDLDRRARGCTDIISHPEATDADLGWAYWSRAYVRCGRADDQDIMADLMSMVALDVVDSQEYFQRAGGYTGPIDGQVNNALYGAVERYVSGGCR